MQRRLGDVRHTDTQTLLIAILRIPVRTSKSSRGTDRACAE